MSEHLQAFKLAVKQYRPWHRPHWNSSGNDAFPQLINGGLKVGAFDLASGAELFNTTTEQVKKWAEGEVPERKERIKVWKTIKKDLGINSKPS